MWGEGGLRTERKTNLSFWPIILLKNIIIHLCGAVSHQHYSLAAHAAPSGPIELQKDRKRCLRDTNNSRIDADINYRRLYNAVIQGFIALKWSKCGEEEESPLSKMLQLMEVKYCNMRLLTKKQQKMQPGAPSESISQSETTGVVKSFNKTKVIRSLEMIIFLMIKSIFNLQG